MDLPPGFQYSGVRCGIKASGKPDLALIALAEPGLAAGVYTQNQIVAAPVVLSRQITPGTVRGVVINSGNANACTGEQGLRDAEAMVAHVAAKLGCTAAEVLVMSTGVIGHPLPMDRVTAGIDAAAKELQPSPEGFAAATQAILTTDQGPKTAHRQFTVTDGHAIHIAGMAKGAGMIAPNMATMLGIVTTNMPLSASQAQQALQYAADRSFNCVSVEGHTSTNDTLAMITSAPAETPVADEIFTAFQQQLTDLCVELAKQIPADGEGAEHLIEIHVHGAPRDADAKQIAKVIADSPLVKTAITGNDPNWGRIVSAAGYAGVPLDVNALTLTIQDIAVYRSGGPVSIDAAEVSERMKTRELVVLDLKVGHGDGNCRYWTSDLTTQYVRFNSEYTT